MRQVEAGEPLLELEHGGRGAYALVSTMASLQNSMPVQAMVPRRMRLGRAERPSASRPAMSGSTRSSGTSRITSFWCGVVRRRVEPCASSRSASCGEGRARDAADDRRHADVEAAVLLAVHADVVARRRAAWARRGRRAARSRGTRPAAPGGTSRCPTRRAGTSGAPCCAGAGSRSRGRSARRRARHPPPGRARRRRRGARRAAGRSTEPPPTHRS